jgi:palmitoyl-[glycerolipid] 3-(E)-desaturase
VVALLQLFFSAIAAFSRSFSPFCLQIKPTGLQTLSSTLSSQELPAISDVSVINRSTYQPVLLDNEVSSDFTAESDSAVKKIRKGSEPEFAIAGDSTTETPTQVAVVAAHFGIMLINLVLAALVTPVASVVDIISLVATFALSVVIGDFGTGVFHWATDNYGSIKTPVFGSVCAAFQGHHVTPWTITFRSFANNVYKICYGTVPALLLVAVIPMEPLLKIFFTLFITWWMISQELHKFSHMRSTPKTVKFFQDMGIILSKKEHGLHHTAPFEGHYCILTGVCNSFLDDSKFFRHMENLVFKFTGTAPTSLG